MSATVERAWKHVVVIGASFGGLNAVKVLARDPAVRVTLVDRNNYHLFLPLLYQVAISGLEAPQIAEPVREMLRPYHGRVRFVLGNAEHVDLNNKRVKVDGQLFRYDYLIVATGSQSAQFGIPGELEHTLGLKSLPEALTIRDQVLSSIEAATQEKDLQRQEAMLTFTIVGAGATGVELAGALAELRKRVIPNDYPEFDPDHFRVVVIQSGPRVLPAMEESASGYTAQMLRDEGVELLLDSYVTEITAEGVHTDKGDYIPSFTTIWTAGVAGAYLPGLPEPDSRKRVPTTRFLTLAEDPRVYVIGDINELVDPATGEPYPQVAQTAIQQGKCAAHNILTGISGGEPVPFEYDDLGSVVVLGRNRGVFERGRWNIQGFPAWFIYSFIHLVQLSGFRNRILVFISWVYSYFTYESAVRILMRRRAMPGD